MESKIRLYIAFALVVLATSFGSMSQTAVNAMLVDIDADFAITSGVGQWAATIYMLVMGITVPAVTYLSKRYSLRRLAIASLLLFLAGAALGAFAPNFEVFLAGRVLQAVSAGITMPLLQTMAMVRFPKGQNATAMGVAGIALGFAPNIGPVLGGSMAQVWGWRSFFLFLVAVSVVLMAGAVLAIAKESTSAVDAFLDGPSLLLSTLGFGGLLLSFSNASSFPLTSLMVLVPLVLGAICVVVFLVRQTKIEHPLINLGIFKSGRFTSAFVIQNLLMSSFLGITLLIALFIQEFRGGTAVESGMVFIPATITALIFNPLSGYLTDKIGVRPVAIAACVFLSVGALGAASMDASTPLWMIMLFQTLRSIGVSSSIGPTMSWGLAGLRELTMDGSSFIATVRQACASLATAIMVFIVTAGVVAWGQVALAYQLAFGFSALLSLATLAAVVLKVK